VTLLREGSSWGNVSPMATIQGAAVRYFPRDETGEDDRPQAQEVLMKAQNLIPQIIPQMPPVMERLFRAGHLRLPTRDLASLGLPPARPANQMTLTEALMLDRGEGGLAR
jgi:hypothetical protein